MEYLPIDGMEETNEIIVSRLKARTDLRSESLHEIGHELHMLVHRQLQIIHFPFLQKQASELNLSFLLSLSVLSSEIWYFYSPNEVVLSPRRSSNFCHPKRHRFERISFGKFLIQYID